MPLIALFAFFDKKMVIFLQNFVKIWQNPGKTPEFPFLWEIPIFPNFCKKIAKFAKNRIFSKSR